MRLQQLQRQIVMNIDDEREVDEPLAVEMPGSCKKHERHRLTMCLKLPVVECVQEHHRHPTIGPFRRIMVGLEDWMLLDPDEMVWADTKVEKAEQEVANCLQCLGEVCGPTWRYPGGPWWHCEFPAESRWPFHLRCRRNRERSGCN